MKTLTTLLFLFLNLSASSQLIVSVSDIQLMDKAKKSIGNSSFNFENEKVNQIMLKHRFLRIEQAFPLAERFSHPNKEKLLKLFRLSFEGFSSTTFEEIKALNFFASVEQENTPVLTYVPNDLLLQGGLADIHLRKINAQQAWDLSKGSSLVKVAVIDNGFFTTHQDLANQIAFTQGNVSWPGSGTSHGSPVAGLVAAQTDNGLGISSIGFNSKLMLYKFSLNQYDLMMNASLNGAKVINCSFYTGCSPLQYEQDIIDMVFANGSVIVASSGNGTLDVSCGSTLPVYPASYNHVISVGGIDNDDTYFNNNNHFSFNNKVDLTAPGWFTFSTFDSNAYGAFSGTSAAAPIVSGTIALMLAANTCLRPAELEFLVKSTTNKSVNDPNLFPENIPFKDISGTGRLDAFEAVKAAKNWPGNMASLGSIKGSSVVCNTPTTFNFGNDFATLESGIISWSSSNPSGLSINPTTGVATRVNNYNGPATITATINGGCGGVTLPPFNVWVGNPPANNTTLIWIGTRGVNPVATSPGASYIVEVDQVPTATSYTWSLPPGTVILNGGPSTTAFPSIYITTPTASGTYSISCRANNACGSSFTRSLTINNGTSGGGNNCPPGFTPPCRPGGPAPLRVFPNPSSTQLTVSFTSEEANTSLLMNQSHAEDADSDFDAKLYYSFGELARSGKSKHGNLTFDIINLPGGLYVLKVNKGREVITRQIAVKH